MLLFMLYGSLAALALWATWRDHDLYWIGVWLAVGWAVSNMLFATLPPQARPGPYTVIEVLVALSAYFAWAEHRHRALVVLVGVNVLSIMANVAFASTISPVPRQIWLYEVTTNMCFAAECLLAAGVGIAHGRRAGRFDSWVGAGRRALEPHVARQRREP